MSRKIHKYKGQIGDTEIHVAGRGEGFKLGMEYLGNVMADKSHKFICLKCGELWEGGTFNLYFKGCPNCGVPEGATKGCYSEMGGTIPDTGIHGIWENHYGLTNEMYAKLVDKKQSERLRLVEERRSDQAQFTVWGKKSAITLQCPKKHKPGAKCTCSKKEIYDYSKKTGWISKRTKFEDIVWKGVLSRKWRRF